MRNDSWALMGGGGGESTLHIFGHKIVLFAAIRKQIQGHTLVYFRKAKQSIKTKNIMTNGDTTTNF